MHLLAGLGGIAFDRDRIGRFRATEQAVLRNGGAAQTRDGGNFRQQIEFKAGNRCAFVASGAGIDSKEEQVFTAVTKVYLGEFGEAADKEPRGYEENYGNGDLGYYQDFSCREAAVKRLAGRTGWSGFQDRGEIKARGVQGRKQSKKDCGEQRHAQGETEHARVRLQIEVDARRSGRGAGNHAQ